MTTLGANFDFFDVDVDDPAQLQAAAAVSSQLIKLIDELVVDGHAAIRRRVATLLGRRIADVELSYLAGRLSPELLDAYRSRWFTSDEQGAGVDGASDRSVLAARADGGGWVRDELTLAIRYQSMGHADPWLRAWSDVLAEAESGPHAAIVEPLLNQMLKPAAPGLCGSCHSVERNASGQLAIQWRPREPRDQPRPFTRFDHGPHLQQPGLRDCTSCHEIVPNEGFQENYSGSDPYRVASDFAPLTLDSCAECHTRRSAGDSCTQCHNYHVGTGAIAGYD
jgi:hypothetical protein